MTARNITKRSTLLATIRSEFPKSTAKDLEDELHEMINRALDLPHVVNRREQLNAVEKLKDFAHEVCPLHREDDLHKIIESL